MAQPTTVRSVAAAAALAAAITACHPTEPSSPTAPSTVDSATGLDRMTAAPLSATPRTTTTRTDYPPGAGAFGFRDSPARCAGTDLALHLLATNESEPQQFALCIDSFSGRYVRAFVRPTPTAAEPHPARVAMQGAHLLDSRAGILFALGTAQIEFAPQTITILWPSPAGAATTLTDFTRWER